MFNCCLSFFSPCCNNEDEDVALQSPKIIIATRLEDFGYDKIKDLTKDDIVKGLGYSTSSVSCVESKGFVNFISDIYGEYYERTDSLNPERHRPQKKGYKLHISIADIGDNLQKGWAIVIENIVKHKMHHAKIIHEDTRKEYRTTSQCGKEITIYAFKEGKRNWKDFIYDVTKALSDKKIHPGPKSDSDDEIKGSNYFSYRNDNENRPCTNLFEGIVIEGINKQPERKLLVDIMEANGEAVVEENELGNNMELKY